MQSELNWRNTKVLGWFGLKLQEIKVQGLKWINSDTIGGLIDFSIDNFERIKS